MRVAKADKEDFELSYKFIHACRDIWSRNYSLVQDEDTWEKWWEQTDEDYIKMKDIKKRVAYEQDIDIDDVDNRIVVYEWLVDKFKIADGSLGRIMMAANVLIDNVCDTADDCISFHPMFQKNHVTPEQ